MMQVLLEPMILMSNENEYQSYAKGIGHNKKLQISTTWMTGSDLSDSGGTNGNSLVTLKGTSGTAEVQTITVANTLASGTFQIMFRGQMTKPIAYNATTADIALAVNQLPVMQDSGLTVAVSGQFSSTGAKTFTFSPVGAVGDTLSFINSGSCASSGGTLEPSQEATISTAGGLATTMFYIMLPTPLDSDGLWLGAISIGHKLTIRMRTADVRHTQTGNNLHVQTL
jgi:hypothetical protein